LLVCHRIDRQREAVDALSQAIASGRLPRARAMQAAERIEKLIKTYAR